MAQASAMVGNRSIPSAKSGLAQAFSVIVTILIQHGHRIYDFFRKVSMWLPPAGGFDGKCKGAFQREFTSYAIQQFCAGIRRGALFRFAMFLFHVYYSGVGLLHLKGSTLSTFF